MPPASSTASNPRPRLHQRLALPYLHHADLISALEDIAWISLPPVVHAPSFLLPPILIHTVPTLPRLQVERERAYEED